MLANLIDITNRRTYIIAEIGANHSGIWNVAVGLIYAAKRAGADCVKFQCYTPDTLTLDVDNEWFRIKDGMWVGETLHQLYSRAQTPWDWLPDLKRIAEENGLDFLCTAYDRTSVDYLLMLGCDAIKVASFEANDIPLLQYIASRKITPIISTGMLTKTELSEAHSMFICAGIQPMYLVCRSDYPARERDIPIPMLESLLHYAEIVGLSDHTLTDTSAIVAVVKGAKIIEKHLAIPNIETADSGFSMKPVEFSRMVYAIRNTEAMLTAHINPEATTYRRSVWARTDIAAGEQFTMDNIGVYRPEGGLPPSAFDLVLLNHCPRDIKKGTPITRELIGAKYG